MIVSVVAMLLRRHLRTVGRGLCIYWPAVGAAALFYLRPFLFGARSYFYEHK